MLTDRVIVNMPTQKIDYDEIREYIEALKDEKRAPAEYKRLLKSIKDPKDRKVIRGIIRDERRHYKLLKRMENR